MGMLHTRSHAATSSSDSPSSSLPNTSATRLRGRTAAAACSPAAGDASDGLGPLVEACEGGGLSLAALVLPGSGIGGSVTSSCQHHVVSTKQIVMPHTQHTLECYPSSILAFYIDTWPSACR